MRPIKKCLKCPVRLKMGSLVVTFLLIGGCVIFLAFKVSPPCRSSFNLVEGCQVRIDIAYIQMSWPRGGHHNRFFGRCL
jgi:hypothetical protein